MKSLLDAMLDEGYDPPDIHEDGRIHRFRAPDEKRGKKSAWYVYHGTHGAFGDWVSGLIFKWHDGRDRRGYSDAETKKRDAEAFEKASARFNEEEANKRKARTKAKKMWDNAGQPNVMHEYLFEKGLSSYHGSRVLGNTLLVPMWNSKGELINLQRILPDGTKRFLYGGEVIGGYYIVGGQTTGGMHYVCEGFATACTIYELTGKHVIVAFNRGNLELVTQMWRRHKLIIAADNDYKTRIRGELANPGLEKGMEIAKKFKLDLVIPVWENCTDWNDLAIAAGVKECKRQLKMKVQP